MFSAKGGRSDQDGGEDPDTAAAWLEKARVWRGAGHVDEAITACHRVLSAFPTDAEALDILWNLCLDKKDAASVIEWLTKAIEKDSERGQFYYMVGCAREDLGEHDAAVVAYRAAMRMDKTHAKAANNLGCLLEKAGDKEGAESMYRVALDRDPGLAQALYNLGNLSKAQGKLEDAVTYLRQAIGIQPGRADWHSNLGETFALRWKMDEALACHRTALARDPRHVKALAGLGHALMVIGRSDLGEARFRQARDQEALENLSSEPRVHSDLLLCLHYRKGNDPAALYAEHLEWERRFGLHPPPGGARHHDRTANRPLNVGYVSADFCTHPVATFLEGPLSAHDAARFKVFCYSQVRHPDSGTQRFQRLAAGWRDIHGMSDDDLAQVLRNDAIDILVDLSGHTGYSRLRIFAAKPAPIQVTWLGYPNTTGLRTMDYRLTDAHADPSWTDPYHSEKLWRLPRRFLCFTPRADAPEVVPPPFLKAGRITFGCFNNLAKVTPEIIGLWSRLLATLPNSRLVLKAHSLGAAAARSWVMAEFAREGIGGDRYQLLAPEPLVVDHLRRYGEIDIALDTFPYHGTTTTCEALWMGVPVITLAGRTHVARVGVSLLNQVDLPEMIAHTPEEYIEKALQLADNPQGLTELRSELRRRMAASPLLDVAGFTAELENAYTQMWHRWCAAGEGQG